jgi:copper homeostasis protein CutC
MANTFIINRIKLERILSGFKVSAKNINELVNQLNKTHRHVNAVAFVSLLHRYGLRQEEVSNILRRMGFDEVTIIEIFNMIDEERINQTYGKIVELWVD